MQTTNYANLLYSQNYQPIITLIMQNEPNFLDDQMNVTVIYTKEYENKSNWTLGKNEPKTNPNEPNSKPISKEIS